MLPKSLFGLDLVRLSVTFVQCQTVFRNSLRSSPNNGIKSLWRNTSNGMNFQYDVYKSTKDILKTIHSKHNHLLQSNLRSEGAIHSFISDHFPKVTKSTWTSGQSKMPKNISNFTRWYLNTSHPTRNSKEKRNVSSFCHLLETLVHIVAASLA